jgi:hypothetical protein
MAANHGVDAILNDGEWVLLGHDEYGPFPRRVAPEQGRADRRRAGEVKGARRFHPARLAREEHRLSGDDEGLGVEPGRWLFGGSEQAHRFGERRASGRSLAPLLVPKFGADPTPDEFGRPEV